MNRYRDRYKGIRGILDPGRVTKEELKTQELDKFYKENIENHKPYGTPKETPLVSKETDITDYIPTITLDTPQKTIVKPKEKSEPWRYTSWGEEPKNKFGHTASQKNKMINDHITKKPDPIKKMVEKNMPILTYVDKMSVLYGGQKDRKYDDQGYPLTASPDQMQGLEKRLINARQMTDPPKDKIITQLENLKSWSKDPKNYKENKVSVSDNKVKGSIRTSPRNEIADRKPITEHRKNKERMSDEPIKKGGKKYDQ